jgi:4-hydroxybenzoate polyprenyltransferase
LALTLLIIYTPMKRLHGFIANMIAGTIYSLLLVFGMTAGEFRAPVVGLAISVFFLLVGREIVLDIRDMEADRGSGIRSIPVLYGARGAIGTATTMFAIGSLVMIVSGAQFGNQIGGLIFIIAALGLLWSGFIPLLRTAEMTQLGPFIRLTQVACVVVNCSLAFLGR